MKKMFTLTTVVFVDVSNDYSFLTRSTVKTKDTTSGKMVTNTPTN